MCETIFDIDLTSYCGAKLVSRYDMYVWANYYEEISKF